MVRLVLGASLEWNTLRMNRILDLNHGVWNIERGVMTILPTGPCHEFLIRLLEEIEEEFRGHILPQDTLKIRYLHLKLTLTLPKIFPLYKTIINRLLINRMQNMLKITLLKDIA